MPTHPLPECTYLERDEEVSDTDRTGLRLPAPTGRRADWRGASELANLERAGEQLGLGSTIRGRICADANHQR